MYQNFYSANTRSNDLPILCQSVPPTMLWQTDVCKTDVYLLIFQAALEFIIKHFCTLATLFWLENRVHVYYNVTYTTYTFVHLPLYFQVKIECTVTTTWCTECIGIEIGITYSNLEEATKSLLLLFFQEEACLHAPATRVSAACPLPVFI